MTTPPQIHLAKNFDIDARSYAIQGNAILGIRDSGKTYTATKIAEDLFDAGIPFIAFDPVGVWRNLQVGTGKHPGYRVVVAGGNAGDDIRLTAENATAIVKAAMVEGVSLIIDLYSSALINKATWIKIVTDSVMLLMYENKDYGLRHVFIEEAAEFIPQRLEPQHAKVYSALERLARMGRNAKLGLTVINQRAEQINKAILEICAVTLLHKQVGKNSLKSIEKWLDVLELDNPDVIMSGISRLERGECFVIGQEDSKVRKIKILPKKTYHPSPQDAHDEKVVKKTVNVDDFVTRMNAALNKPAIPVKEKPAGQLNGKDAAAIEQYQKQIADFRDRINVLTADCLAKDAVIQKMVTKHNEFWHVLKNVLPVLQGYQELDMKELAERKLPQTKMLPAPKDPPAKPAVIRERPAGSGSSGDPAIGKSLQRMLGIISLYDKVTRKQLGIDLGMVYTSGTFNTYLSQLKVGGYIEVNNGYLVITDAGRKAMDPYYAVPISTQDREAIWLNFVGAGSGVSKILSFLINMYPDQMDKQTIADNVGMAHNSGTFNTYLSKLRKLGLIEGSKEICAAEELFT